MFRTNKLHRFLLVSAISSGLITGLVQQEVTLHAQEAPSVTPTKFSVVAIDKKGRVMLDVKAEDFRIVENGVEQKITHFSKDDTPITYGLVVDNSGSLKNFFPSVIGAAKEFVTTSDGDESFVVRFVSSDIIIVKEDFTSNTAAVARALDSMFVERGQTAVIDAVYFAADKLKKRQRVGGIRRRALVVLSDGEDRGSAHKLDDLLKLLRESDIQVYCIGFLGGLNNEAASMSPSKREQATSLLNRLASETGGRAYFPLKVSELQDAFKEIQLHLHARNLIGYTPAPMAANNRLRRKVEVKIVDAPGRDKRLAVALPILVESNMTSAQDRE